MFLPKREKNQRIEVDSFRIRCVEGCSACLGAENDRGRGQVKGKRVGTMRRGGRYLAAKKHIRRTASSESRGALRLVVCGVVFVLVVALKLLFPQAVGELAQRAAALIGQNADFRAAFAAVGRAVSGEEPVGDSLQDAYTAVFSPSGINASVPERWTGEPACDRPGSALAELTVPPLTAEESKSPSQEQQEETAEVFSEDEETTLASSAVYMMPALPENASLEQKNLGFAYTTPVCGTLTSAFGWREHPTEGGTRFHYGIDFAAEEGTDIVAFADGEVFATGESSTLGKYIILQHSGSYKTLYAHCSAVTVTGGSVCMGEVIARVGETGTATGPHLHFELQNGSMYFNPIYYVAVG